MLVYPCCLCSTHFPRSGPSFNLPAGCVHPAWGLWESGIHDLDWTMSGLWLCRRLHGRDYGDPGEQYRCCKQLYEKLIHTRSYSNAPDLRSGLTRGCYTRLWVCSSVLVCCCGGWGVTDRHPFLRTCYLFLMRTIQSTHSGKLQFASDTGWYVSAHTWYRPLAQWFYVGRNISNRFLLSGLLWPVFRDPG